MLCLVLIALKRAFSAPKIYTVDAGYLIYKNYFARLMREPAWLMSLAPTNSPNMTVRFGATAFILFLRYSERLSLYSAFLKKYLILQFKWLNFVYIFHRWY